MEVQGYIKKSKYGSNRISFLDYEHVIEGDTIEVITAATFTSLAEEGLNTQALGGFGTPAAQVATVTLTGTVGTCNITVTAGLTRLATFNNSLTETASDFVTAHEEVYLDNGIILTSSGADILFTAGVPGDPFDVPVVV